MILGFKQFFDKQKKEPTYFREKIQLSGGISNIFNRDLVKHLDNPEGIDKSIIESWKPKLHTLRLDPHNRWKPGMSIQMVYRGPKYSIINHFNKGIPELDKCVSVQLINIINHPSWIDIVINDRSLKDFEIDKLVVNDGFSSFDKFCKWFNKDWEGKIIHWTYLRY